MQKFQIANKIVSSGDPQSTGFGRVVPQTLKALSSLRGATTQPVSAEDILRQGGDVTFEETGEGAGVGLNIPPDNPYACSDFT